jgi:hypothetical protein
MGEYISKSRWSLAVDLSRQMGRRDGGDDEANTKHDLENHRAAAMPSLVTRWGAKRVR